MVGLSGTTTDPTWEVCVPEPEEPDDPEEPVELDVVVDGMISVRPA
jgi:hypothetical protein